MGTFWQGAFLFYKGIDILGHCPAISSTNHILSICQPASTAPEDDSKIQEGPLGPTFMIGDAEANKIGESILYYVVDLDINYDTILLCRELCESYNFSFFFGFFFGVFFLGFFFFFESNSTPTSQLSIRTQGSAN